jgi:heme exporter protein C
MNTSIESIVRNLSTAFSREAIFLLFAFTVLPITLLALTYPPTIVEQGQAQRIFYLHVPLAWVALYAPFFSALSGLLYIFRRDERFDVWSLANARLAFLFALGALVSGMLWGSIEWGTYWRWSDARLMSFFVLLLTLAGYFLVRWYTEDPRKQAIYSAVMALLASLAALLTWFAIRVIEPDLHPPPLLNKMSPKIGQTFWISVLGYHLFFWVLVRLSVRQEYFRRVLLRSRAERA